MIKADSKNSGIIKTLSDSAKDSLVDKYDFLREQKKAALEILHETGIPDNKNEEYKYFPAHRKITDSLKLYQGGRSDFDLKIIEESFINDSNGNHLVYIDGQFSEQQSKLNLKKGIQISILNENEEFGPVDSIVEHSLLKTYNDPFLKVNQSSPHSITHVNIEEGITGCKIYFYNYFSNNLNNELLNTQTIIKVGANSSCEVTEIQQSQNKNFFFDNGYSEIHVGENAKLNLTIFQEYENESLHIHNTHIYQETGSVAKTNTISIKGGLLRNNLVFHLTGSHCESYLDGLYYVSGKNIIDNHTIVDHLKPDTYSNEYYKGIIDDRGKGVFNGKIFVRPDAQKTNAFQSNKNIVLTDTASINTKPQLEIWADDVKCSHGATTGQMDEEQLFYLRSRGLGKKEAKALLLHAFANEIIERIETEELRLKVEHKINDRLGYRF